MHYPLCKNSKVIKFIDLLQMASLIRITRNCTKKRTTPVKQDSFSLKFVRLDEFYKISIVNKLFNIEIWMVHLPRVDLTID